MNQFNSLAAIIALLMLSAIALWPAVKPATPTPQSNPSLLKEDYLGDGLSALVPLPQQVKVDAARVALGKRLFSETQLSGNGFSCATCHPVERYGMDGLQFSIKTGGGFDVRNTPTVLNSGFNSSQLWSGNAASLEAQIDNVINNPLHMDSSWDGVVQRLQQQPDYVKAFKAIYADGINQHSVSNAIAEFERSLVTPDSALDRYLRGDKSAMSNRQQEGMRLFQQYGCISCHQGINIGGNLLARFGIYDNALPDAKKLSEFDYGRYTFTGDPRDKFVFRVPSLRNVAKTAPYFHDGSVNELSEAIRTMARIQLNLELPDDDVHLIEEFLHSLTGQLPDNAR